MMFAAAPAHSGTSPNSGERRHFRSYDGACSSPSLIPDIYFLSHFLVFVASVAFLHTCRLDPLSNTIFIGANGLDGVEIARIDSISLRGMLSSVRQTVVDLDVVDRVRCTPFANDVTIAHISIVNAPT